MIVRIIYYQNEEYLKKEGIVVKIDEQERYLVIVKEKINFNDIFKIEEIE